MTENEHHWITLHRVRFPNPISALEKSFDRPAGPEVWRFCPELHVGNDGMPTFNSATWCGLALHHSRDHAEELFENAARYLPFGSDTVEQWHGLFMPIAHRGTTNWSGTLQEGTVWPSPEKISGPIAIFTTAHFLSRAPDQVPRISHFMRGIQHVVEIYRRLPGNVCGSIFSGGFDGRDGFTFTLWQNEKTMYAAAYGEGTHRTYVDQNSREPMVDHTSFTRARLLASHGTWEGQSLQERATA